MVLKSHNSALTRLRGADAHNGRHLLERMVVLRPPGIFYWKEGNMY